MGMGVLRGETSSHTWVRFFLTSTRAKRLVLQWGSLGGGHRKSRRHTRRTWSSGITCGAKRTQLRPRPVSPGGMQPSLLDTAGRCRDSPPSTHPTALGGDNPVLPISCNTNPPRPPAHLLPPLQGPPKPDLLWHQLVRRIIRVWREARAECSSGGGACRSEPWQRGTILPSFPPWEGAQQRYPAPGSAPGLDLLLLISKHLLLQVNLGGIPAREQAGAVRESQGNLVLAALVLREGSGYPADWS